jgi:pimeloyl-ACP methyl ester carboxylesterase
MSLVTINGQQIHITEEGPAHGPVAVLIHGWSSSSHTWKPLIPQLRRRFRCLAVDLPGFGNSPAPRERPSIEGYAELIAGVIRWSGEDAAVVLGHSMGGMIGITLTLSYPLLVERLVLLNPAISGRLSTFVNTLVAPHIMFERFDATGRLLSFLEQTPLDYSDRLLKPIAFAERAEISSEDYERIRADARRPGQGRTRAQCFWAMRRADLRGRLAALEVPALVLWGAEDNTVPLRDAGTVAAEWPEADLRIIPNAGHWPQFEQAALTRRYVANFLGLPRSEGLAAAPEGERELAMVRQAAEFLANCEVGNTLTLPQRMVLASQVRIAAYEPGELIARAYEPGDEMFIVQLGQLLVQLDGDEDGDGLVLTTLKAGQVAGEMALIDGGVRSASLRAGPSGALVLSLHREKLQALKEDDPELGMLLMQNLAVSLGKRLRIETWKRYQIEKLQETVGKVERVLA